MLRDWTDVLLLHLLRDAKVIERLIGKLEPADVSTVTMDNVKGYLWGCSREYYSQTGTPIPHVFLVARLAEVAQAGSISPEEVDSLGSLVDFIYNIDSSQMNTDIALQYAQKLLETARVQQPVSEMLQEGIDVSQVFSTFQSGIEAATIAIPQAFDPLSAWGTMLGSIKPVEMGGNDVQYFNKLLHGGMCPGEIAIMLGPMGGFKTTIAIDVVCSMAKLKRYTAYMSYEQAFRGGDLPVRFMSRMTNIDRDILMTSTKDQLSDEQKKALVDAQEFSKYIMFLDRSAGCDKVEDIAAQVRSMISSGCKPELIVIDQLMTWMQQWPEASNSKKADWFRQASTDIVKKLKAGVCEKFGLSILLLHQVTAGEIGKRGGQTFGATDSQENKAIGNWADFVVTIGTKCADNNIFKLNLAKARRGVTHGLLVQAIPAVCKFRYATDWEEDPRSGRFVMRGEGNKVPSVDKKGKSMSAFEKSAIAP